MSMTDVPAGRAAVGRQMDVHVTGRRVVATIVDGLLLGGLYSFMAAMFGTIVAAGGSTHWIARMPVAANVAYALLVVSYYVLLEGYLGQTVGKMLVGVRVVGETTNEPPGLAAAAVRTVLRPVDGLLGYLVAFITVLATPHRQRLGDLAARTLVVRV